MDGSAAKKCVFAKSPASGENAYATGVSACPIEEAAGSDTQKSCPPAQPEGMFYAAREDSAQDRL